MPSFRKKPVVIEARQFDGFNALDLMLWSAEGKADSDLAPLSIDHGALKIATLEGELTASPGDWIIRGVKGEFYPCKPDVFLASYEPA